VIDEKMCPAYNKKKCRITKKLCNQFDCDTFGKWCEYLRKHMDEGLKKEARMWKCKYDELAKDLGDLKDYDIADLNRLVKIIKRMVGTRF